MSASAGAPEAGAFNSKGKIGGSFWGRWGGPRFLPKVVFLWLAGYGGQGHPGEGVFRQVFVGCLSGVFWSG